jgi:hypothetical protein
MAATILDYTFGTTDRGVKLSEGEIIRPWKDDSWTKIRVAIRYCALDDPSSAPSAGAAFLFGVCSGSTNTLGSATTDHAIFFGNARYTGTYNPYSQNTSLTDESFSYAMSSTPYAKICKRENSLTNTPTDTSISFNTSFHLNLLGTSVGSSTFYAGCGWLDITRGSPNYTVRAGFPSIDSTSTTSPAVSRATFLEQMISSSDPDSAGLIALKATLPTAKSLAIDEATYGTLDHVCVFWNRSAPTVFIQDIIVVKLA